ncbi:MAG: type II toxin-antitoxin system PemK/MazF family toxin [Sulfurimonas sp.]|nr:type II toxin-antitoxin system PemK/MazF family toxin [Sulfurimonas sp.]
MNSRCYLEQMLMEYKRGTIVLVNFNPQKIPEEISKVRPAIIISDTDLNDILDLVSVVALTTNLIDDALPLRIRINKKDLLLQDSDAMCEQLRSISKSRITKVLSTLNEEELKLIEFGIKEMLGL